MDEKIQVFERKRFFQQKNIYEYLVQLQNNQIWHHWYNHEVIQLFEKIKITNYLFCMKNTEIGMKNFSNNIFEKMLTRSVSHGNTCTSTSLSNLDSSL